MLNNVINKSQSMFLSCFLSCFFRIDSPKMFHAYNNIHNNTLHVMIHTSIQHCRKLFVWSSLGWKFEWHLVSIKRKFDLKKFAEKRSVVVHLFASFGIHLIAPNGFLDCVQVLSTVLHQAMWKLMHFYSRISAIFFLQQEN